jgi:hypothetical protein
VFDPWILSSSRSTPFPSISRTTTHLTRHGHLQPFTYLLLTRKDFLFVTAIPLFHLMATHDVSVSYWDSPVVSSIVYDFMSVLVMCILRTLIHHPSP